MKKALLSLRQQGLKLAVREGFEPSVQFNPYDGLANRSFRPLRHLTYFIEGVAKIGKVLYSPKAFSIFYKKDENTQ